MMQFSSTVTRKGQVTIPQRVRQHLGISTPDEVTFVIDEDEGVRLIPAARTLESIFGSVPALSGRPETVDFEDQIEEAMAAEADRIARDLEQP